MSSSLNSSQYQSVNSLPGVNSTLPAVCGNPTEVYILITIYSVLICVVVVSNTIIVVTFAKTKKLRTTTNIYFVSLAVSDILVGSVSIPMWIFSLAYPLYNNCKYPGQTFYDVYKFLDIFSALASTAHLMLISFERSLAITKPLMHRSCPKWFFYVFLSVAWMYGLTMSVLIVIDFTPVWKEYRVIAVFVMGFGFPLLIIMILYALTYRSVKQYVRRRRSNSAGSFQKYLTKEKRTAKTVGIVLGVFVIAWLPFFIVSLIGQFRKGTVTFLLINFVKILHFMNSAINPYIYTFRNATWKWTFLRAVSPCTHKSRGYWKSLTSHARNRSNKSNKSSLSDNAKLKPNRFIRDKMVCRHLFQSAQ